MPMLNTQVYGDYCALLHFCPIMIGNMRGGDMSLLPVGFLVLPDLHSLRVKTSLDLQLCVYNEDKGDWKEHFANTV